MLLRAPIRFGLLAALAAGMPSCALIDATAGSGSNGGTEDSGVSGPDGAQGCTGEGGCYRQPTFFQTGLTGPHTLFLDLFDADSDVDLVVASDSGAAVYFGDGNGGFNDSAELVSLASVSHAAIGNFNGDGPRDVVIFDFENGLQAFVSSGTQSFTTVPIAGISEPHGVLALDVVGNGVDDLLVEQSGSFLPLANNGAPGFEPQPLQPLANTDQPRFLAGRFTNDSYDDVAYLTPSTLYVHTNDGDWILDNPAEVDYVGAKTLTAWQAPGDPHQLLAVLSYCEPCSDSIIAEFYNASGGSFTGRHFFTGYSFDPIAGVSGNFGLVNNGFAIASSHAGEDNILLLDNWDNGFQVARLLSAGNDAPLVTMAVGDLNQDGVDDIVVAYEGSTGDVGIILSYPP